MFSDGTYATRWEEASEKDVKLSGQFEDAPDLKSAVG